MKMKSSVMLLGLLLLLVTACRKELNDPMNYYFFTSEDTGEEQWTLYIDDDLVGPLTYSATMPSCTNTADLAGMLQLSLSNGRHTYEAKDAQGVVRSSGYFQCKETTNRKTGRSGSTPNGTGGSSLFWGNCDFAVMSVFAAE